MTFSFFKIIPSFFTKCHVSSNFLPKNTFQQSHSVARCCTDLHKAISHPGRARRNPSFADATPTIPAAKMPLSSQTDRATQRNHQLKTLPRNNRKRLRLTVALIVNTHSSNSTRTRSVIFNNLLSNTLLSRRVYRPQQAEKGRYVKKTEKGMRLFTQLYSFLVSCCWAH